MSVEKRTKSGRGWMERKENKTRGKTKKKWKQVYTCTYILAKN